MTMRTIVSTLLIGILTTTSSCDPATAVVVPVLVITATWQVEGEDDRSFRFDADQNDEAGLEQGTFQGFEEIDTGSAFVTSDLTGSWANGQIQFTVERTAGSEVYSGTFHSDRPNRLTLHSNHETIVIFN